MLNCKSCGASNDANSSVCEKCGASLRKRSKKRPTVYKDIYSNTDPSKNSEVSSDNMDVFSSGEMFEKAKKDQVLDKIYKQELALGEVPTVPSESERVQDPEPEPFKPTVINREITSDIVGNHKTGRKERPRSRDDKIPQRIIESSRPQTDGDKKSSSGKNGSSRKTAPTNAKQKQKTKQKPPVKKEAVFGDDPMKKPKPADEELVPLTPPSRNLTRTPGRISTVHEKKLTDSVSSAEIKTEEAAPVDVRSDLPVSDKRESVKEKTESVSSDMKPEAGSKKKPNSDLSERPVQKAAVSDSVTKAVKSEKPDEKEKNRSGKAAPGTNEKKKPVTQKKNNTEEQKRKVPKSSDAVPKPEGDVQKAKRDNSINTVPKAVSQKKENRVKTAETSEKSVTVERVQSVENGLAVKKDDNAEQVKALKTVKKAAAQAAVMPAEKPLRKNEEAHKPTAATVPKRTAVSKTGAKQKPKPRKFFSDADIKENSTRAALSYFGILFLIPYFKRNESKLCRAHSKQGIAVFVYSIIIELLTLLLVLLLRILTVWVLKLPFFIYNILFALILAGMAALLIIPVFVGAKAAFNGIYKTVPIVGKYVKKSKGKNKSGTKKPPVKKSNSQKKDGSKRQPAGNN